jgi:hypothetical protein
MPDLETFAKICGWLEVDPNEFLGSSSEKHQITTASVHFRKDQSVEPQTAISLANLILAAQSALRARAALRG